MRYAMAVPALALAMVLYACGTSAKADDIVTRQMEALVLDQISCRVPPQAGIAVRSMLKNNFLRHTNDGGDGTIVFVPTQPIELLGFPIVRISGWQMSDLGDGSAVAPFERVAGTAPPNFFEVVVKGAADDVRQAALKAGLQESTLVDDESMQPFLLDGQMRQPQRQLPGFAVAEGDNEFVQSPATGVATISCAASEHDFR